MPHTLTHPRVFSSSLHDISSADYTLGSFPHSSHDGASLVRSQEAGLSNVPQGLFQSRASEGTGGHAPTGTHRGDVINSAVWLTKDAET